MPVGPRIEVLAFDPTKKSDWLTADINGFVHVFGAILAGMVLLAMLLFGLTGIDMMTPLFAAVRSFEKNSGINGVCVLMTAISLPAFIIVFVMRRNPTVVGKRRQLRYICRWL